MAMHRTNTRPAAGSPCNLSSPLRMLFSVSINSRLSPHRNQLCPRREHPACRNDDSTDRRYHAPEPPFVLGQFVVDRHKLAAKRLNHLKQVPALTVQLLNHVGFTNGVLVPEHDGFDGVNAVFDANGARFHSLKSLLICGGHLVLRKVRSVLESCDLLAHTAPNLRLSSTMGFTAMSVIMTTLAIWFVRCEAIRIICTPSNCGIFMSMSTRSKSPLLISSTASVASLHGVATQ